MTGKSKEGMNQTVSENVGGERRRSRRVRRRLEVMLVDSTNRSLSGQTLDVSSFGARLVLPRQADIAEDGTFRMTYLETRQQTTVKVVWVAPRKDWIEAGVSRILSRTGNLRETGLHEILFELMVRQMTGMLRFFRGVANKSIYLEEGGIVWADSDQEFDSLASLMLRAGRLSQVDYDRLIRQMSLTGETSMEKVLLQKGHLKPEQFEDEAAFRTGEIVKGLFGWSEGDFEFMEGLRSQKRVSRELLNTSSLVVEGLRKVSADHLEQILGFLGGIPLSISTDPLRLFQQVTLLPEEKDVMSMIDGRRTLADIMAQASFSELTVKRAIAVLAGIHLIELGETIEETPEVMPEADTATFERAEVESRIDGLFHMLGTVTHYDVLDVQPSADMNKIKRSYYRMARDFHPDHHYKLGPGYEAKLNAIFSRVNESYDILSDEAKRKSYDQSLDVLRSRRIAGGAVKDAASQRTGGFSSGAPPSAEENYRLGNSRLADKDYAAAVEFFKKAVQLDPSKGMYAFAAGKTLMLLPKRMKEAEEYLLKAVERDPFNTACLLELGNLYLKARLGTRAVRTFQEVVRLDPENVLGKKGLAAAKKLI